MFEAADVVSASPPAACAGKHMLSKESVRSVQNQGKWRKIVKNLSIKGLIILVVALAGVSTAYATPPTTVTGDWSVSNVAWGPDGEFIPTIALTGALEGEFTHGFENGRADHIEFVGCVGGVYGSFKAITLAFHNSIEARMVVKQGSGGLQNLRGQGSATITGVDDRGLLVGEYEMDIHFDPSYPGTSPECE